MKEGQKGTVSELCGGDNFKHRMASMGVYPGRDITKISHFALKGPVTIKVGRSLIALGHGVAEKIIAEIND